jgi:hypothetical protein
MKFQELYRIFLNTAIELVSHAQLNPWTQMGASFALGALRGKGVDGALQIPLISQFVLVGGKLGLINTDDTVDLPNIIAGLENMVEGGKEIDLGFLVLDSKDIQLLISNLKKEQQSVGQTPINRTQNPVG